MVTYLVSNERIVFTAEVEGHGSVEITSRRPGFFSGRLQDRKILRQAMAEVEAFADEHRDELREHYARIGGALTAA